MRHLEEALVVVVIVVFYVVVNNDVFIDLVVVLVVITDHIILREGLKKKLTGFFGPNPPTPLNKKIKKMKNDLHAI